MLDLGSEWDQNKRVISLKNPGAGAHGAIPPNFGYFAVEFGHDGGGYAKVIEDWASFPLYFGRVSYSLFIVIILQEPLELSLVKQKPKHSSFFPTCLFETKDSRRTEVYSQLGCGAS